MLGLSRITGRTDPRECARVAATRPGCGCHTGSGSGCKRGVSAAPGRDHRLTAVGPETTKGQRVGRLRRPSSDVGDGQGSNRFLSRLVVRLQGVRRRESTLVYAVVGEKGKTRSKRVIKRARYPSTSLAKSSVAPGRWGVVAPDRVRAATQHGPGVGRTWHTGGKAPRTGGDATLGGEM